MTRDKLIVAILFLLPLMILCTAGLALPADQKTEIAGDEYPASQAKQDTESATLEVWNRPIVVFRCDYEAMDPEERAADAKERIEALPESALSQLIIIKPSKIGKYDGVLISIGDHFLFGVLKKDIYPLAGESLESVSQNAVKQLQGVIDAKREHLQKTVLARGLAKTGVLTFILLVFIWIIQFLYRRISENLARFFQKNIPPRFGNLKTALIGIEKNILSVLFLALVASCLYVWFDFAFRQFPYTRPLSERLHKFIISTLIKIGSEIIAAVPNIFIIIVIFFITRFVVKLVRIVFQNIEKGALSLKFIQPDTARVTRGILTTIIWLFAFIAIYHYIPGSHTDVFKGIGILAGVMISLGTAGLINQIMSSLVIIYSRAVRQGEYISIGDMYGVVDEVSFLSTKLVTNLGEKVTVPNAVMVSREVVNYSRLGGKNMASVTLSIGYDAAWRQVHELLLKAAGQAKGVSKDPEPYVLQKSLSDFYVQYELRVHIDPPQERFRVLSEVYSRIQDLFNEAEIQIMSPHYEIQPGKKVFVPRPQWKDKTENEKNKGG